MAQLQLELVGRQRRHERAKWLDLREQRIPLLLRPQPALVRLGELGLKSRLGIGHRLERRKDGGDGGWQLGGG